MKASTRLAKSHNPNKAANSGASHNAGASHTRLRRLQASRIPGFSPRQEDTLALRLRGVAPERLVLGAGGVSLVIYITFVLAFPIFRWWNHPHLASDPTAINDIGRITAYSPLAAAGFVAAVIVLFACQFLAMTGVTQAQQAGDTDPARSRLVRRAALAFPIVAGAVMVWMQPVTTTDLYGYVARGYLYAQLHINPMTHPASLLPGGFTVARPAAPYGPAWLLVCGLVSRIFGNNLLANMLAFKFIGLAGVAVSVLLVDWLAKELFPAGRLRIDVLFGWSPLLIFEAVGNGHNDIIMVVCVLAALACMSTGRSRSAFALLVLGALIKYFSAVFVVFWLAYELRHRVRPAATVEDAAAVETPPAPERPVRAAPVRAWFAIAVRTVVELDRRAVAWLLVSVTAIGATLTAAFYAPFWTGFRTFTGLGQQLRPLYYNSSLVGFFTAPLELLAPQSQHPAFDKTVRLLFYGLFALYVYLQAQGIWLLGPRSDLRDVITASAKVTFAALLLITFWFQPWYVIWLLPLAALAKDPFVRHQSTILAGGALMTYAVGNYLLVNETGLARDMFVQFFEILAVFGPLLILQSATRDTGWSSIARKYAHLFGSGLRSRPVALERLMLVLILIVAALLRLLRLGDLFVAAPNGSAEVGILTKASGDLRIFLQDPKGLQGPFVAIQGLLVRIFGQTPFAALLPSAALGSLTVLLVYLVTQEILRHGNLPGSRIVALLAALLAATSHWHVSLSRSGTEVVVIPLLLLLAVYWLLLALREEKPTAPVAQPVEGRLGARDARRRQRRPIHSRPIARPARLDRRRILLYAGAGVCTGLACDTAPGLWLVPLLILGVLLIWRLSAASKSAPPKAGVAVLAGGAILAGIPVIWHYINPAVGFPAGSSVLARAGQPAAPSPSIFSIQFWQPVGHNALAVVHLLLSQDYSAGYPSVGGTPIIPTLLGPFFYLGLAIIIYRWRNFGAQVMLLLVALPLVASVAVGAPTGVIEAGSVLPAMCIVPAYGIYTAAAWLGHLPIVIDRINGARVFSTPEQMGRLLLLVFLMASTVRTFFWYFEATLPSAPPPQFIPSYVAPSTPSPAAGQYVLVWAPGDYARLAPSFNYLGGLSD
ncbi:MAG TPA: glycosyltransferase family 39 protein [Ktedonobacterales bacterium]|nr:glycosyltransferase family 39 protein [Ktedonobacterales bacterium]